MIKKFLTVLLFVLITSPAFSAGSSGGSGSGGEAKPVSQYQIGEKMINNFFYRKYKINDYLCGFKAGKLSIINKNPVLDYGLDIFNLVSNKNIKIQNIKIKHLLI